MDFKWKEKMEASCDEDGILKESFTKYPEWEKKKCEKSWKERETPLKFKQRTFYTVQACQNNGQRETVKRFRESGTFC